MFLFEVKSRLKSLPPDHAEGRFQFFTRAALDGLSLPQTDREQIWPWFWRYRGGFFAAHCHCHPTDAMTGRSKSPQLKDIGLVTVDWGLWTDFMDEPIIDLHSDDYFMREALRQAVRAYEADEVPVGAVIAREGRIIARAFNQVEQLKDATAHAEMLALTQAEETVGDWRLTDCTLYVTKEPCPMCAGAMVHTRLRAWCSARAIRKAARPAGR